MQTSLIVATLKRLLPVGLNICAPGEQDLIALAKNRFSQVGRNTALANFKKYVRLSTNLL